MVGLGIGAPIVQVYHEKSFILPDVSRVLACLYEKDVKFETHTASYKSLLRLQASSHAPVPFYDGPTFLEESREICRYIAEKYEHQGYPFLLGKDALERASVEQWLHNEEHAFNPPSRALFCHLAFPLGEVEDDDIHIHTRKLEEVLEVYEQRLSDSEFLVGNKFTLADLVHLPNSHYIKSSNKFLYLYDSRKNVRRWWDAISDRDSWKQVLRYMKRVEEQNKQEELKKKQQQKEDPRTSADSIWVDSRKQTRTEPQTILVPPTATVASSSIVPRTKKPLPSVTSPDEILISSSHSPSAAEKTSADQSNETTFITNPQETPPTSVQSTPVQSTKHAASPTTAKKPPITDAAKPSTNDASILKPSSSKDVSSNLDVFDHYPSHTDVDTPYIEPTTRKTSSISAREEPDQPTASDFYKSDSRGTSVDSRFKEPVPYSGHTPSELKPTDTYASKLHTTNVQRRPQVEQWHSATTGLNDLNHDADHLASTQQGKPRKDVQQYPSQGSEQATSHSVPQEPMSRELVQGPEKTTRRPYTDQRGALLPPSAQEHGVTPSRQSSSFQVQPSYFERAGAPSQKQETIDDTFKETESGDPSSHRDQQSGTWQTASSSAEQEVGQGGHSVAPPSQTRYQTPPSKTRYPIAEDASKQARGTAPTPKKKAAEDDNDTSKAKTAHEVASTGRPLDAWSAPFSPRRQKVEDSSRADTSFQKRYPYDEEDIQVANTASVPRQIAPDGDNIFEETKLPDSTPTSAKPMYTQRYPFPPARQAEVKEAKDKGRQSRVTIPESQKMVSRDAQTTHGEKWTATPGEQSSDGLQAIPQSRSSATKGLSTKKDITNEQTVVPPLLSNEPTSRIQPASESLQEVASDGGLPTKPSTIEQWQRASVPLNDIASSSGDGEIGIATIDQKLAPMSRQATPSSVDANQMAKESGKQRVEPPVEIEAETPGAQSASSLPGASTAHHTTIDDKFSRQSIIDERVGEPTKMPPIPYSAPSHTKRETRDGHEIADPELVSTPDGHTSKAGKIRQVQATDHEDVHDANLSAQDVAKDTFKEAKVAESTPSSGKPMYHQQPAPTPRHAKVEDTWDKGTKGRETVPDRQQMLEKWAGIAGEQLADRWKASPPSRQAAAEDVRGATGDTIQSPDVLETSKKSRGVYEEAKGSGSVKEEKTSSIYQKKPLVAEYSQEQAQTISAGEKADGSIRKHQQASDAPNTFVEKLNASEPASVKTHSDFSAEQPYRKDMTDDQKVAPPISTTELTSQVQPPSEPLYDPAPHRDLSSQPPSTIYQWQRSSVPLHDVISSPGDDEVAKSAVDEKPTPMSQQKSVEQRAELPVPIEAEISGVPHNLQSFPGASMDDRANISDKFAMQPITDERVGEPTQMQTSSPDAHPASEPTNRYVSKKEPTKRETPEGHEIGDLELVSTPGGQISEAQKARDDPATVHEDVYDVNLSTQDVGMDALKETKVTDSIPSSAQPIHIQKPARTSRQTQVEEARNKSMQSRETIPEQQNMVERKTGISGEQLSDRQKEIRPSIQPAAEDAPRSDTIQYPDVLDTTKKSRATFEEYIGPGSTLPQAQVLDAQDSQHTKGESTVPATDQRKDGKYAKEDDETIMAGEKSLSTERLREMLQESASTAPKTQLTESEGSNALEKTSSVYHKGPLDAQDSKEEAQVIPADEKVDRSPSEHHESSGTPYSYNEKVRASAPTRADIHDGHSAEEQYKKYTANDQEVAPSLSNKEPASQVQPASEPLQRAVPDGDLPSKSFTIDQWQRTAAPLPGVITDSGDDEASLSSKNDQKSRPMSQEATPSSQMAIQSGRQSVEPPVPIVKEASDVATTKDEFTEQSNIDERVGKPIQKQAPITDAHPTSTRAMRRTPDSYEAGELVSTPDGQKLEAAKFTRDPATIHEDVRAGIIPAEEAHSEQKSTPSDKGSARAAQPPSPVERMKTDSDVFAANYTNAPQTMFRQQARPSAPSTIGIPASDTQGGIGKIQEVTPDIRDTDDSRKPFDPNQEHVSHASQAIPGQEEMTSPQGARVFPMSGTQLASAEVHKVTPDDQKTVESITPFVSSGKQDSRVRSPFKPGEVGPDEKKFAPSDQESPDSSEQSISREPRKEQTAIPTAEQTKAQPTFIGQQDIPDRKHALTSEDTLDTTATHGDVHRAGTTEPARRPLSVEGEEVTSATQAPTPSVARGSLHTELENVQSVKPSAAPDARDITSSAAPGEALLAEQKSVSSGQGYADPAQPAFSLGPRNEEIRDSSPSAILISPTDPSKGDPMVVRDQAKDSQTIPGQQDILPAEHTLGKVQENIPGDDLGKAKPSRPSSAVQEGKPAAEVAPDTQHGAAPDHVEAEPKVPSGQGSVHSVQTYFSTEPTKEDTVGAGTDQTSTVERTVDQNNITPAADKAKNPFSSTPDALRKTQKSIEDDHIDEKLPSQRQVSAFGHVSESPQGRSPEAQSDVVDKETTLGSSQAETSKTGPGSTSISADARPSSSDMPAAISLPETQDLQDSASAQNVLTDSLGKLELSRQLSTDQAMAPIMRPSVPSIAPFGTVPGTNSVQPPRQASTTSTLDLESVPDTQNGILHGKATPIEEKSAISDQEPAHTTERPSSTEPRKEEANTAAGDQPSVRQGPERETTVRHQAKPPPPDSREALQKYQQPSLAVLPSDIGDGPTPGVHGPVVDMETTHTSVTDSDSDSTRTRGDVLPTRSVQNQEAQPPPATQAPTSQGLQNPAFSQNDSLGNIEQPRQASPEQTEAPARSSAAQPGAPQGTELGPNSYRSVQSPFSTEPTKQDSVVTPSSQPQTSSTGPDSTQIVGDARLSSAGVPATSSIKKQEAEPPAAAQATSSKGLQGSVFTQNDSFGNIESSRQASTDQTVAPMSQEATPSSQSVSQMAKQSGEQRIEPPVPIVAGASDVGRAAPSLPETARAEVATISDNFADQSNIDERVGKPKQMQAPITVAHPTSARVMRRTPDSHEAGELVITPEGQRLEAAKATRDPATIHEDLYDASLSPIDEKTATDEVVKGSLHDQEAPRPASTQAQPSVEIPQDSDSFQYVHTGGLGKTESAKPTVADQEAKVPAAGPTSLDPRRAGIVPSEVAHSEQKSTPPDKGSARAAQPPSPVEPIKADSDVSAANNTNAPQMMFRQQAKPSAPSTIEIPGSGTQGVIGKIQEVTPVNRGTDDSGKPFDPNQKHVSRASQAIPSQEEMTSPQGARVFPMSDAQLASAEVPEVTPDNQKTVESITPSVSSGKQGSQFRSPFKPGEVGPAEKKFALLDQESTHSSEQLISGEPRKEQIAIPTAEQTKAQPTFIGRQDIPNRKHALTSEDTLNTTATHGDAHRAGTIEPARRPSSVEGEELTFGTQTPSPNVGRDSLHTELENVQSVKPSATPDARDITPSAAPGEAALADHKSDSSGQGYADPAQPAFSLGPRNEEIRDSSPSAILISPTDPSKGDPMVVRDQAKDSQTIPGQQDILPAEHTLGKVQENIPGDDLGKAKPSRPSSSVQEGKPAAEVAPDTQHGAAPDHVEAEQKVPSGQGSVHSVQTPFSTEPTKEDTTGAGTEQTSTVERTVDQNNITPAADKAKNPFSSTPDALRKTQKSIEDDHIDEKLPTQRQVSAFGHVSESPQGRSPEAHSDVDKETTLGSSQAETSKIGPGSTSISADARPSSSDMPAASSLPETQDLQDSVSAQNILTDSLGKLKSPGQLSTDQAMAPVMSPSVPSIAPLGTVPGTNSVMPPRQTSTSSTVDLESVADTQNGIPEGKATPAEQKSATSDQEPAHTTERTSSAEPRKEETNTAAGDQPNVRQGPESETTVRHQAKPPPPDSIEALQKYQQPSHAVLPSDVRDRPTPGVGGPVVDKETTHTSVTDSDSDSTRTHGDVLPTRSVQNQEAQPPPATQAPTFQDLQNPAFSHNDSFGNIEQPRQASTEQTEGPARSSAAQPGAPEGTAPGSNSYRSVQSPFSTEPTKQDSVVTPGNQAQTSSTGPDSTRIVGDTRLSSAGVPATSSIKNQEAEPPAAAQATSSKGLQNPAFSQNDSFGNIEQPRQASTEQTEGPARSSAAQPGAPEGTAPGSNSYRSVQSPFSTEPTKQDSVVTPGNQAQTSSTGPDSTQIVGDAGLSSSGVPATSSIKKQEAEPPAAAQATSSKDLQNPAFSQNDSFGNIEQPRQASTEQTEGPARSSAAQPGAPEGTAPGSNSYRSVQSPFSTEPTKQDSVVTPGNQAQTLSTGPDSTQIVGDTRLSSVGVPATSSIKKQEAEPPAAAQATSSKGLQGSVFAQNDSFGNIESSRHSTGQTVAPATKSAVPSYAPEDTEPGPNFSQSVQPPFSNEPTKEPENQQLADQDIAKSLEGNEKQALHTKPHETESAEPENLEDSENNINRKNNRTFQVETLDLSGKQASVVQQLGKNTKDEPYSIDNDAPSSETGHPSKGGLPANRYQNNSGQSQAEGSNESVEQSSPGIRNKDNDSSKLDDSTDPVKPKT